MGGVELAADVGVVLGALVNIFNQQHDWRSGGDLPVGAVILEYTGQDFDFIGLLALGGEAVLAGPPLVKE